MSSELWADNPELQKQYNKIVIETRRLQAELGVKPRTLAERHADLLKRQEEERKIQEQLKIINSIPRPKLPPRQQ